MAKAETIMVSASPAEAAAALVQLPDLYFDDQDDTTTYLVYRGAMVAIEHVEDEDGIYRGRTTSLDVYGKTQEKAIIKAELLYKLLEKETEWGLAMHFDEFDTPRWSRTKKE